MIESIMTMNKIETLKAAIENLTTALMDQDNAPCILSAKSNGNKSCLQKEIDRTRKLKRNGYQDLNSHNMCQSCAAAFHVDCARLIFCFGLHDGPNS